MVSPPDRAISFDVPSFLTEGTPASTGVLGGIELEARFLLSTNAASLFALDKRRI